MDIDRQNQILQNKLASIYLFIFQFQTEKSRYVIQLHGIFEAISLIPSIAKINKYKTLPYSFQIQFSTLLIQEVYIENLLYENILEPVYYAHKTQHGSGKYTAFPYGKSHKSQTVQNYNYETCTVCSNSSCHGHLKFYEEG